MFSTVMKQYTVNRWVLFSSEYHLSNASLTFAIFIPPHLGGGGVGGGGGRSVNIFTACGGGDV